MEVNDNLCGEKEQTVYRPIKHAVYVYQYMILVYYNDIVGLVKGALSTSSKALTLNNIILKVAVTH